MKIGYKTINSLVARHRAKRLALLIRVAGMERALEIGYRRGWIQSHDELAIYLR